MAPNCTKCNKKSTKTRLIDTETGECNECSDTARIPAINLDLMLSELSVRDFTVWFKHELDDVIQKKVVEATKAVVKDVENVKKDLKKAKDEIKDLTTKVNSLSASLTETKKERDELKKVSSNNLKYLINHDRNVRRSNVMLFGVPEKENMIINGAEAKDDDGKINSLLAHLKVVDNVEIVYHTRLGKESEDSSEDLKRPIEIVMKNSNMSWLITSNSHLLKSLNQKIFFKPDKTPKEREEFQRLLKKKEECMLSHPTEEGSDSRVVLKKGVLTVDNRVIDRYNTPQTLF